MACRRCGREEAAGDGSIRVLDDACTGSVAGRAIAHASGSPNHLWQAYRHSEADFIVKGGSFLQASRVPQSMFTEEHTPLEGACVWTGGAARDVEEDRRAMPWERDPDWLYLPHLPARRHDQGGGMVDGSRVKAIGGEQLPQRGAGGHLMRVTGPMAWCARCACHAVARHGIGFKGACMVRRNDATQKRLQRLHSGRHLVTGKTLV